MLDFEKAYDKIKCQFLFQTLKMKGFSTKWISLIKSFVTGGNVAINVNEDVRHFFKQEKAFDRVIHYPHYSLTW
jgi:hypothetical protein